MSSLADLHNDDEPMNTDPILEGDEDNNDVSSEKPEDQNNDSSENESESTEEDLKRPDLEETDNDTPGVEQFLSQYGITAGMIEFEDGEKKHFNDLTESEKFNILSDLSKSKAPSLEAEYGLDENEIGLINYFREKGGDIEAGLQELAEARAQQMLALAQAGAENYDEMSDDAITLRWLKSTNPEATEEDLTSELDRLKEGKFYETNANKYRDSFKSEQYALEQERAFQERAEMEEALEEDRKLIATVADSIDSIAGFKVSNEEKNAVLADLLEVNEHGDSLFLEKIFGDPTNLVKAAWLYQNAETYMNQLEDHYKKELSKSYAKGKEDALHGLPSRPVSGMRSGDSSTQESSKVAPDNKPIKSVTDIHGDD